jgi:hypothetical protein
LAFTPRHKDGAGMPQDNTSRVQQFLKWESQSRDCIAVKKVYVKVAGDIVSGVLLSQIVYWNLPSKSGDSKLRVEKEGKKWIAKTRQEWQEECGITVYQFDRAVDDLQKKGLVEARKFRFNNAPTTHIWLNLDALITAILDIPEFRESLISEKSKIENPEVRKSPTSEIGESLKSEVGQNPISITETTTETTTETKDIPAIAPDEPVSPCCSWGKELASAAQQSQRIMHGLHQLYVSRYHDCPVWTEKKHITAVCSLIAAGRTEQQIATAYRNALSATNEYLQSCAHDLMKFKKEFNQLLHLNENGGISNGPSKAAPPRDMSKGYVDRWGVAHRPIK